MKRLVMFSMVLIFALGCIPDAGLSENSPKPAAPASSEGPYTMHIDVKETPIKKEPVKIAATGRMPFTFADCYKLALKQSEIVGINIELIKQAEAHFLQAISIDLPHISFISTDSQEEQPVAGSEVPSLKPPKSSERRFNVKQTLFSGFKEFAAMKGANSERGQRINQKIRAEQLLLVDVSDAFYLLIEKREDVKALYKTRKALLDRVKELKERERLGRSRLSEVINAKAQLYNVEASIELVKNQEVVARQILEFLVGTDVEEVADSSPDFPVIKDDVYYVSQAVRRPDVLAAKDAWNLAKAAVVVAHSGFLPTVNVEGNYYTQRTAFDKGTDWDVTLNVKAPIFEGTEIIGNVKEASAKEHAAELEYQRLKRIAYRDVLNAYASVQTAILLQTAVKKVLNAGVLNYHLQKKDYRMSLVNNLDVLQSIQTWQDAQRNYIHALYETRRLYWQLLAATGMANIESLNDSIRSIN